MYINQNLLFFCRTVKLSTLKEKSHFTKDWFSEIVIASQSERYLLSANRNKKYSKRNKRKGNSTNFVKMTNIY